MCMVLHEIEKIYNTIFMIRTYAKMNFIFYNIYSIISTQLTQVNSTQPILKFTSAFTFRLKLIWISYGQIQVYF